MPGRKGKSAWPKAAFGDVVRLCRERSADPVDDGFDRYLGLEHLEPGDLKIRRWGNIADGTTFTNVFRAGQVLFGKRRAYQRKVAVADFDGVCSGDIYVLESAYPKRLLPEMLPFICQTDRFFEHAVGTSAGSLSPRTNWESLARFEFALPPLDEQRRIAKVFGAAREHCEALRCLVVLARAARESLSADLVERVRRDGGVARIGDCVAESAYGPRFSADLYSTDGNAGTVRTTDFTSEGGIDLESVPSANLPSDLVADHKLQNGDFLLSRSGAYAGMVRVFQDSPSSTKTFIPAAFLIRFRLDQQRLLPHYLREYCESTAGRQQLDSIARGSAQPNISGTAFMSLVMPMPSVEMQAVLCSRLQLARQTEFRLTERVAAARALQVVFAQEVLRD